MKTRFGAYETGVWPIHGSFLAGNWTVTGLVASCETFVHRISTNSIAYIRRIPPIFSQCSTMHHRWLGLTSWCGQQTIPRGLVDLHQSHTGLHNDTLPLGHPSEFLNQVDVHQVTSLAEWRPCDRSLSGENRHRNRDLICHMTSIMIRWLRPGSSSCQVRWHSLPS